MSIISEVKCARCDRQYSGVRSRCPYCGARRIGSGKYSEEGDSSKGKMMIGVMILAVLVVAAGILLFTTPRSEDDADPDLIASEPESPQIPEDDTVSIDGDDPEIEPSDEPSETPPETTTPVPRVQSIEITYAGDLIEDFMESRGTRIPLRVRIEPPGVEFNEAVVWRSSDASVFEVVPEPDTNGTAAMVTIVGGGQATFATLTASIDGVEAECIVRVRG